MNKERFRELLRRRILMAVLLALQLGILVFALTASGNTWRWVSAALQIFSLAAAVSVIGSSSNSPFKLLWIVTILVFPLFGGVLYIWNRACGAGMAKRLRDIDSSARKLRSCGSISVEKLPDSYIPAARYLQNAAGYPVFSNTQTEYFASGEEFWESLVTELAKAKKYIFLEFFIVQQGKMWDRILKILKEKAAAGVDVRIMYDDVGCFLRLPKDYPQELEAMGIKCRVFNPFRPWLSAVQNNRDHRKIVSVDGKVAFTGGVNLADEYINEIELFGHWKDSALRIEGEAAWSLTVIFLEMWHLLRHEGEEHFECPMYKAEPDGYVQPYADSPMDSEYVGARVFMNVINSARDYLYIATPYLILDDTMINSLVLAAKSGVDVRIMTPHHADKPLIHATTRSYYLDLIRAGVKIYEYIPGFVHSKTVVADDSVAIVGTTNFDCRSLYLHFECGVVMSESKAVAQLKDDFSETIACCRMISEKQCRKGLLRNFINSILRLFAPLL